jgi:hypothetical protein
MRAYWQQLSQVKPTARCGKIGMMIPSLNRKWLARTLGATLAVVIMVGCAGSMARAAEDDDNAMPDEKFLRGVLEAVGLRKSNDDIDYRERSPLVVPPSRNLASPNTSPIVEKNPAWPTDADIKRRRDAKAVQRNERPRQGDSAMAEGMNPLRPSQMKNNNALPPRTSGNPADNRVIDYSAPMKPNELGYKGGLFSSLFDQREGEYGTFTGEAPRASLIEPPPGYRTPSPTQPYGVGKDKADTTPKDRMLLQR